MTVIGRLQRWFTKSVFILLRNEIFVPFKFRKTNMKQTLIFLLFISIGTVQAQVIVKEQADTILINRMFLSPEEEARFNSEESINKCVDVWKKMEASGRKNPTAAERKLLSNCNEMMESPWEVIGGGCSWYCGEHVDTVTATSSLPQQGKYNYDVKNIFDLDYQTAWVEGVPGYGIGEKITYHFPGNHPRITEIILVNGYVVSEDAWFNNSRVKTLNIYYNEELFATLHLKDTKNDQVFRFDPIGSRNYFEVVENAPDWKLTFEIVNVYEGDLYDDTVISELYFFGVDVH